MLSNKKIADKISIRTLLDENNMHSVNQTMAQMKLCEMWKVNNVNNYPIKVEKVHRHEEHVVTRAITNNMLKETAKSNVTMGTFINDAIKAWNKCPNEIKEAQSYNIAKRLIKSFSKTLPI